MKLLCYLNHFTIKISRGEIEIYNEASIQFELAIYLRECLDKNKYKIQLERNISYFNLNEKCLNGEKYLKKEMDIVIFDYDKNEKHCIELKFPTQGQYPEQMFSACKDIKFLEQLVKSGFNECYFMMFADDPLFYKEKENDTGIYKMFRSEKVIKGTIKKPTGKKDIEIHIDGEYNIEWQTLSHNLRCFIIEVRPEL